MNVSKHLLRNAVFSFSYSASAQTLLLIIIKVVWGVGENSNFTMRKAGKSQKITVVFLPEKHILHLTPRKHQKTSNWEVFYKVTVI